MLQDGDDKLRGQFKISYNDGQKEENAAFLIPQYLQEI
jgi:hypothetical protein